MKVILWLLVAAGFVAYMFSIRPAASTTYDSTKVGADESAETYRLCMAHANGRMTDTERSTVWALCRRMADEHQAKFGRQP